MILSRSTFAAVVGAEVEIRFKKDMEHPVQLLPYSQITVGPPGLASSSSIWSRSVLLKPIATAEMPQ